MEVGYELIKYIIEIIINGGLEKEIPKRLRGEWKKVSKIVDNEVYANEENVKNMLKQQDDSEKNILRDQWDT